MIERDLQNEDTKVAELIGSLPRVDAPKDFNFHVKARIASGSAGTERPSRLVPAIGLAAPAVLALGLGSYWFLQTPRANTNTSQVAVSQPTVVPQASPAAIEPKPTPLELERAFANIAPSPAITRPQTGTARTELPSRGGGSVDSGVSEVRPKFPRGINPDSRVVQKPRDIQNPAGIPAKDILMSLGAEVEFSSSGYRVTRVRTSSIAERSGVKEGDLVEAINEQTIEKSTAFKGPVSGKTVRVKRNGTSVQIDLTKP